MPPPELVLAPDDVHIWKVDLSAFDRSLDWAGILSPDESARAERYVACKARDRFVAGRVTLRRILSRYTGQDPGDIQFEYGPQGKPQLPAGPGVPAFNVSHSASLALYAVTLHGPVGIDLEGIRPIRDAAGIVGSTFSPGERALFRTLSPADRMRTFHHWWVLKEAYIKGLGLGHAQPLDTFNVVSGEGMEAGWQVTLLPPIEGYAAALAVPNPDLVPRYWVWKD